MLITSGLLMAISRATHLYISRKERRGTDDHFSTTPPPKCDKRVANQILQLNLQASILDTRWVIEVGTDPWTDAESDEARQHRAAIKGLRAKAEDLRAAWNRQQEAIQATEKLIAQQNRKLMSDISALKEVEKARRQEERAKGLISEIPILTEPAVAGADELIDELSTLTQSRQATQWEMEQDLG